MIIKGKITIDRIIGRILRLKRIYDAKIYYNSLKNIHKGKRGFVIGNGPSLKIEDLNKLKNEITIASNKIYLAFEETDWRPNYYTVADPILWPKIKNEIFNYDLKFVHIPGSIDDIPCRFYNRVKAWSCPKAHKTMPFTDNFSEKVYGGGTVTYENIQFAFHLGLNPIYIIGCDHNYSEITKSNESVLSVHGEKINHFHKDYRVKGEKVLSANIELMNASFNIAKKFLEKEKVEIYNATCGGNLNIFKRKDFQTLFVK
jgi:hypothetical protein